MVDAADHEKLDGAKNELHSLLDKPQLSGIPVSRHPELCTLVFVESACFQSIVWLYNSLSMHVCFAS